ncbi:MAG: Fic family protein [Algicola sp.]|nr:Fic family protein [Algicola sp.]
MTDWIDIQYKDKHYPAYLPASITNHQIEPKLRQAFEQLDQQLVEQLGGLPNDYQRFGLRYQAGGESAKRGVSISRQRIAMLGCCSNDDRQAKQINHWIEALQRVTTDISRIKNFTLSSLQGLFHQLLDNKGKPVHIRHKQSWVGSDDIAKAVYIPPPVASMNALLSDLCLFLNRDDIPATAQAALAFAQFITIHPLRDGNGRFARALSNGILIRRLKLPVTPPTCLYFVGEGTAAYKSALTEFQSKGAIYQQYKKTLANEGALPQSKSDSALLACQDKMIAAFLSMWKNATQWSIKQHLPLLDTLQNFEHNRKTTLADGVWKKFSPLLIQQPVFTIDSIKGPLSMSVSKINIAIEQLEKAGIIEKAPVAKAQKQVMWCVPAVLKALKNFDQHSFLSSSRNKAVLALPPSLNQQANHPLMQQPLRQKIEILTPFINHRQHNPSDKL